MDANRFEMLLRSLSGLPSRRGALRLLAGSALGSLITPDAVSTAAKKKGGKGKKGKKKKQPPQDNQTTSIPPPPVAGPCDGQPDDTPCNGDGLCLNGVCNPQSPCAGRDVRCGQGDNAVCCQAPRNGTATCGSGGSCNFVCNQGYKRCDLLGGACIPTGDCCTDSECQGTEDECQRPICDHATGRCGIEVTKWHVATYRGERARPCYRWICGPEGVVSQDFDVNALPPQNCNECTSCGWCTTSGPFYPPRPDGTPCSQNGGTQCDGAGNCIVR